MTRNIILLLLVCTVTLPISGSSPGQFEGIIETKNTTIDERGAPQQFTMIIYVKQGMVKVRNSPIGSSPGSTMIYRGDTKLVWMLDEEDKSYFEIRQDEPPEQMNAPSAPDVKEPVVRTTGKKKHILHYACDQIIIRGNNQETELCATKSLGRLYDTISKVLGGEGNGQNWENKIMKMGYYPLVSSTKVEGKVLEYQEVTKIEKKLLPQDVFELPEGFKKQTMGEKAEGDFQPDKK